MLTKNSHCSYCGAVFTPGAPWPRTCGACKSRSYLNPIPVVVVLVPAGGRVVVVRRNIDPQRGSLALPGGYIDPGETWQEGGSRELLEETGIIVPPDKIALYDVCNGLDNTLVVFGLAQPQPRDILRPFSSAETREVVLIDRPMQLGFPMHTRIVERHFRESVPEGGGLAVSVP